MWKWGPFSSILLWENEHGYIILYFSFVFPTRSCIKQFKFDKSGQYQIVSYDMKVVHIASLRSLVTRRIKFKFKIYCVFSRRSIQYNPLIWNGSGPPLYPYTYTYIHRNRDLETGHYMQTFLVSEQPYRMAALYHVMLCSSGRCREPIAASTNIF